MQNITEIESALQYRFSKSLVIIDKKEVLDSEDGNRVCHATAMAHCRQVVLTPLNIETAL